MHGMLRQSGRGRCVGVAGWLAGVRALRRAGASACVVVAMQAPKGVCRAYRGATGRGFRHQLVDTGVTRMMCCWGYGAQRGFEGSRAGGRVGSAAMRGTLLPAPACGIARCACSSALWDGWCASAGFRQTEDDV